MSKAVILKSDQSMGAIFGLEPKIFTHEVPQTMLEENPTAFSTQPFKISDLVAQTSGLSELQKKNQQELIEAEILRRLKEVEEKGYSEAHKLGMIDGKKEAFEKMNAEINQSIQKVSEMLTYFESFKEKLFLENEEHLIKLVYKIAESIVVKTINEDKTIIASVLKKAIDDTQGEEEIVVRVNQDDFDFLQTVTESKDKPWDNSKKVKLEVTSGITRGGCLIETNHGVIDAAIETRVKNAWENLESRIPKEEKE